MNRIMNWLSTQINHIRTWWSNNHEQVGENLSRGRHRTARFINRLARNITRCLVIGVILNVIVHHFYPEFAERFPVLYGWFDGWLQLFELGLKAVFGSIYALFTGHFGEFWAEYQEAFNQMCQQFTTWLSNLHF